MAYIYQDGKIDGQDVRYWHKQYIEQRNRVDQLEEELVPLRHMKLAIDNTIKENELQHTHPELWRVSDPTQNDE